MDGHWALEFGEAHHASSLCSCSPFTLYHPNFSSSALETSLKPEFWLLWWPHLPHTIRAGTCQVPQESPDPTDRTLLAWHPLLPMFTNKFGNYHHDWHRRPYSQNSKEPCQLWKDMQNLVSMTPTSLGIWDSHLYKTKSYWLCYSGVSRFLSVSWHLVSSGFCLSAGYWCNCWQKYKNNC